MEKQCTLKLLCSCSFYGIYIKFKNLVWLPLRCGTSGTFLANINMQITYIVILDDFFSEFIYIYIDKHHSILLMCKQTLEQIYTSLSTHTMCSPNYFSPQHVALYYIALWWEKALFSSSFTNTLPSYIPLASSLWRNPSLSLATLYIPPHSIWGPSLDL